MSDHERHWNDLLASDDPGAALVRHFSILTDSPSVRGVLEAVFDRFEDAHVENGALVVSFEDDWELVCDPPADTVDSEVPAAYARVVRQHNGLTMDVPGGYLSIPGVDEEGALYPPSMIDWIVDSAFYQGLEESALDEETVSMALGYIPDEFIYVPTGLEDVEMAVYFVPHESCEPYGPMSGELTCPELFSFLLAEHLLEDSYFTRPPPRFHIDEILD